MKVISVINLKGGVAKTTTATNMAYILATSYGKKVLVIDNDKQGNLSKTFRVYDPEDEETTARMMTDKNCTDALIKRTKYENIDIITANMGLIDANMRVMFDQARPQQTRFRQAFNRMELQGKYDYCIIDNAPDINIAIINALVVTDDVIVPIVIDQYSFDGLRILTEQIEQVRDNFNDRINMAGCLITNFQRNEVNRQGNDLLKQRTPIHIFKQTIRRTDRFVQESTFAHIPVVEYSVRCGASQDYRRFVAEYMGAENLIRRGYYY